MVRSTFTVALLLSLAMPLAATGQIVLRPIATGTVEREFYWSFSSSWEREPTMFVGNKNNWTCYYNYPLGFMNLDVHFGVVEFPLQGCRFPYALTANNFTARLEGITVLQDCGWGAAYINIFDLWNEDEDGQITKNDMRVFYGEIDGSVVPDASVKAGSIPYTLSGEPPKFQILQGTDVTQALRRDLFGNLDGGVTSGFILHLSSLHCSEWVLLDQRKPKLVISINGWDGGLVTDACPGVGAIEDASVAPLHDCQPFECTDTGCDMDADMDSDTDLDVDTDTDSDGDSDNYYDANCIDGWGDGGIDAGNAGDGGALEEGSSGCGCDTVGAEV